MQQSIVVLGKGLNAEMFIPVHVHILCWLRSHPCRIVIRIGTR